MKILVFTTVFPNKINKNLGLFVKERVKAVSKLCEIRVIAPIPYFPLDFIFRPKKKLPPSEEFVDGIKVYHPRFYYIPGFLKFIDGFFLYLSTFFFIKKLKKDFEFDLIDSHFAYPDGFAAVLLGKNFAKPVTITLRGTENTLINFKLRKYAVKFAVKEADKIFSVNQNLINLVKKKLKIKNDFVSIPNGINLKTFIGNKKETVRKTYNIPADAKVIISVGGLVERKGHHRVLEVLPELKKKIPDIFYIIVGGATVEGNNFGYLTKLIKENNLKEVVLMTGEVRPSDVNNYLSASDVFVLPTRFEGWANVFFEAMVCGLPVVTTDVGGNREVIKNNKLGIITSFDDKPELKSAVELALSKNWDKDYIKNYAKTRNWDTVGGEVFQNFKKILKEKNKKN
ncbi:MAG: glycosyltransferase [Bacillota bacterium]